MSEEKNPDQPTPQKQTLHAVQVNPALVLALREAMRETAQEGSEGYKLCEKIDEIFDEKRLSSCYGSLLVAMVALAYKMADENGMPRTTVMATFCHVILARVVETQEAKKFSPN